MNSAAVGCGVRNKEYVSVACSSGLKIIILLINNIFSRDKLVNCIFNRGLSVEQTGQTRRRLTSQTLSIAGLHFDWYSAWIGMAQQYRAAVVT